MIRVKCVGILLFLSSITLSAFASTICQPTQFGSFCTSQVNFVNFTQQAYQSQLQSQWCWAATISMIYSYYKHPVNQSRIVTEVYGAPVNMPATSGMVIAQQLNRNWVDDNGNSFSSQLTGAFDPQAGIYALNNNQIISELDQEHPLVIGTLSHAMVLTQIQYYQTPFGPNVVGAGVFDPWPGIGARSLSTAEITPITQGGQLRFLAIASLYTPTSSTSPFWGGGCTIKNVKDKNFDPTLLLLIMASGLYWLIRNARGRLG